VGKERKAGPGRRRGREIEYYVVVEGTPNPDVLLQNYIWCLKQREQMGKASSKDQVLNQ
jgi:hypothetical protein